MRRPLYAAAATTPDRLPDGGHAGLWFDKFVRWPDTRWSLRTDKDDGGDNPKLDWLCTIAGPQGDPDALAEASRRIAALADARLGTWGVFGLAGRFVTGLGRPHPVENGFAWHPTLATPFLPGSSVKGMTRAFAQSWEDAADDDIARISGDQPGETRHGAGSVVFLPALPTARPTLIADTMTPHYGDYYQNKQTPGDWLSPVPVPFLVVEDGSTLQFALLPRHVAPHPCAQRDAADVDQAWAWLTDALAWTGAGAKTAAGYGRFDYTPNATDRQQAALNQQRQAEADRHAEREREEVEAEIDKLPPAERWPRRVPTMTERELLTLIRTRLQDNSPDPLPEAEERDALRRAIRRTDHFHHWARHDRPSEEALVAGTPDFPAVGAEKKFRGGFLAPLEDPPEPVPDQYRTQIESISNVATLQGVLDRALQQADWPAAARSLLQAKARKIVGKKIPKPIKTRLDKLQSST